MKKIIKMISAVLLLSVFLSIFVSADSSSGNPTYSYSYWLGYNEKTLVYVNPMYEVETVITGDRMGYTDFINKPNDIYCASDGKIYITENDTSRLTVLDSEYNKIAAITSFVDKESNIYEFYGANGVYEKDGAIYVSDTANARVLVGDISGNLIRVINAPDSSLLPDDFVFMPLNVAIDKKGYMYIVSSGSTYGALLFNPDGTFEGFYGANSVKATVSSVLGDLWNRFFATEEQLSGKIQKIPYQFTDIVIDNDDFVYTITGAADVENKNQEGQIRRLSPKSKNTLTVKSTDKYSNSDTFNFGNTEVAENADGSGYRLDNFTSIAVDSDGYIYALESTYGRIFVYDSECNLLCAFGGGTGKGEQNGSFVSASSLAVSDGKIFVTDSGTNRITVFKINEYGKLLKKADNLYIKGKYTEGKKYWQQINKLDSNCQLAYWGLAKACLLEENYDEALYFSKEGLDYASYNQAFSYVRSDRYKNLFPVALLTIAVVCGLIIFCKVKKRKIFKFKINRKVSVFATSFLHPFETADLVKNKKEGSLLIATVSLAVFYIFKVLETTAGGFLFTRYNKLTYNSFYTLLGTVGVVLIFVLCYWAMAVLFSGKCKIKDVYIITCYALLPQIFNGIFFIIFSNILVSAESAVISAISVITLIMSGIIMCIGLMVISDYGFFKFLGVTVTAVIAMIVVIFVIFMVAKLDQELIKFISGLVREIKYR